LRSPEHLEPCGRIRLAIRRAKLIQRLGQQEKFAVLLGCVEPASIEDGDTCVLSARNRALMQPLRASPPERGGTRPLFAYKMEHRQIADALERFGMLCA
jgi:hypothetical protein